MLSRYASPAGDHCASAVPGMLRMAGGARHPRQVTRLARAGRGVARCPCHTAHDSPSPGAADVYTECARIWNPVHTDAAVAAAAGLPAIILHGTATLAMAVSRIVMAEAGGDPERIAEVYGRFGGMVLMPSDVMVRIHARE